MSSAEHSIQQTNKKCKNRRILVKSPAVSEPLLLLVAVPKRQQQNQPKVFNRLLELEAIQVAVQALASSSQEQDAARLIKQHFDLRFGPCWHCVIGANFGCLVSHLGIQFVHFYIGTVAVLLFRTLE